MNVYLRKGWHILGLAVPALYYFGLLSKQWALILIGAAAITVVTLEIFRYTNRTFATVFTRAFRRIMRTEEYGTFNATIPYLISSFLVLLVFPRVIAWVALAFLSFGDTAAELVGRPAGRVHIAEGKTLEGTLACFSVCFLVGWYFLGWQLALVGAAAAALAELVSGGLADNFTVPLAAGAAVWLAGYFSRLGPPA
jgi:dolichol kinase